MYSDKLEELISAALQDGNLTEQKRNIIMRRAEKEGEDVEEVMMVVESRLHNITKTSIKSAKPKKTSASKSANKELSGNSFIETVNGVSFKMIKVEGGTFTMFNDSEGIEFNKEYSFPYAKPQKVTLDDYYIGETVVTQELWKAVMGKKSASFHFVGNNLPVNDVKPDEINRFLEVLNKLTNKKYHLPSEAQWEYAAIGGKYSLGYKYAGSDEITKVAWCDWNSKAYTEQDMIDFYNSNHFFKAKEMTAKVLGYFFKNYKKDLYSVKPVALLRPNELGLYDMCGNVSEVCEDDYDDDPILNNMSNPIFKKEEANCKVCRSGGSNSIQTLYFRTYTNNLNIVGQEKFCGFRIAL